MTKQELQDIFESPFDWDNWRKVMDFVFPEFKYALHQEEKPLNTTLRKKYAQYIKQHGNTQLTDGETLVLYEVSLTDQVRLDRNVKSVRKLISNEVFTGYQIGLGVFHSENKSKWRFTLVIREFTPALTIADKKPESYTYVFGAGERGRTAAERFYDLSRIENKKLKDLETAFSVEALSKKFFTQYKEVYLQFVDNIKDNASRLNLFKAGTREEQEKLARDFVKKMMGRIVFLYFLQKKGWMGCQSRWQDGEERFMQKLFEAAPQDASFYMTFLEPLFFDTLNAKRAIEEEECIINGIKFGKVPFLNGGLFEREESHPANLTLDWEIFSRFFETLNNYNFTIIEDDPDFKEIAVDPEMLGHIFENLLEDNKDKGAFYTPKEIVQYMCQESLIEYLNTQLGKNIENEALRDAIRDFVVHQEFNGLNDISQRADQYVLQALRYIKVCDPAIGSGAFPMGILHEIYRMVEYLQEDRDIFLDIWDKETWDAARVKEDIIQNSIYGVDIEKGAVDIARLRFWLSIIIEEEEPKPLPNLDYKIMQGNSLLERFGRVDLKFDKSKYQKPIEKQANLFGEIENPQISIAEAMAAKDFDLTRVEQEFFHAEDPLVKERIRKEITEFEKSFIDEEIKARKDKAIDAINILSKKLRDANYSKITEKKKDEKLLKIAETELVEIGLVESQAKEIKEDNKPYFLWNLYFMDVFEQGGFDLVIGNPPYIQLQKMGNEADKLHKGGYDTYLRTGDIYCLFYELGKRTLLKDSGSLNYITSNSWLRADYGRELRKYFCEETAPLQLIDLSDSDIFETATVRTSIFHYRSTSNDFKGLSTIRITRKNHGVLSYFRNYIDENSIDVDILTEDAWVVRDLNSQQLYEFVTKKGIRLKEWKTNIYRGLITGFNEAFIIDEVMKDYLINKDSKNESIIKAFLRGKDISRYSISYKNTFLINTHNGVKALNIKRINVLDDYPAIAEHLNQWQTELKKRADQGDHWTNLRNCAYLGEFEKPKIVYANMSKDISFTFDNSSYYTNQKCYIMTGEKLKYLLGVLNSKLFAYCFEDLFPEVQGNAREINKVVFETIPIKYPDDIEEQIIESKVNEVLRLKEEDQDSSAIEKEIDQLVYKLYDLSYEQVQVIEEGKFALSEEEYNNISLEDIEV